MVTGFLDDSRLLAWSEGKPQTYQVSRAPTEVITSSDLWHSLVGGTVFCVMVYCIGGVVATIYALCMAPTHFKDRLRWVSVKLVSLNRDDYLSRSLWLACLMPFDFRVCLRGLGDV